MTNQEAIVLMCFMLCKERNEILKDAIKMAIEALKVSEIPTGSDLISRRDAIDEIKALYEWHDTVTEDRAVDHIKRLPSAEPKTGKWVKVIDQETPNVTKWHYECDQCGAGRFEKCQKYCSRCGAMMIREDGES